MQAEKKYLNGLLNADDDFALVAPNEFVNASNIRFGSTDSGATGRFEKIGGTSLIFNTFLEAVGTDTYTNLAACEDEARQRIIFITYNANTTGGLHLNAIYAYDKAAATTYTVLKYDQVSPSSLFQFDVNKYIDAIRVWGDLLYWTDGNGEVKVINIESGIKLNHGGYSTTTPAYVSPVKAEDIVLIKRPCIYPPVATKSYDNTYLSNNIGDKTWQFGYIYEYADFQQSVVSTVSLTQNFNRKEENYNRISVSMPLTEDIPQTVRKVKLVAKQLNNNSADVVKVWDKDITADATAIATHNAGTVDADRLTYVFYNDRILETLSDAVFNKIEESIPRDVETLEVSNDRLFLANYASGFENKGISSLTIAPVTGNGLTVSTANLDLYLVEAIFRYDILPSTDYYFRGYFVNFPQANPGGYYAVTGAFSNQTGSYPTVTAPTGTVTLFKYCGNTIENVVNVLYSDDDVKTNSPTNSDTGTNVDVASYYAATSRFFKNNGVYSVGIAFYDQFNRIIEASALDANRFAVQNQVFAGGLSTSSVTGVTCTVSNTNALNEIPDGAYYYGFIITKNLITRNFLQFRARDLRYGRKNSDGTYTLDSSTVTGNQYLVVSTAALREYGLGYIYNTEGNDLIRYYLFGAGGVSVAGQTRIVGQVGDSVLLDLINIGVLDSLNASHSYFEIYTPYKQSATEFYYESATKYAVTSPDTSGRTYSTLSATIKGDTAWSYRVFDSIAGYSEVMSLNDSYPYQWLTDAGRPIAIVKNKKIQQTNSVAWSNTRFLGTQLNGSSAFELNNNQQVSVEAGAIRKLQNASRLQEEGGVMIAICERETLSLYVGRAQVSDENQFNLLLKSDTVIGTVNGLRGSFGTRHPESVVEHRGNIYWFDVSNGAFVRYASNGLFDISSLKFKRPTTLFAERVRELTISGGSVPNFRNKILGGIDVKHEEVLWSIPETYTTPPKGRLSDYSNTAAYNYPYDIYDGVAKTLVYKIAGEKWMGSYSFISDGFVSLNNELHTFSQGLYKNNNTSAYNTFFGTVYPSKLMFTCNQNPSEVKTIKAIGLEADATPTWTHIRTEWPNVQSTELLNTEYTDKEGRYYASLFRDRLSPNTSGSVDVKMLGGDVMRGQYVLVNIEFAGAGSQLNLRFATIYYNQSYGHKA